MFHFRLYDKDVQFPKLGIMPVKETSSRLFRIKKWGLFSKLFLGTFLVAFLLAFGAEAACPREELIFENWFAFLKQNNPKVGHSELTGLERSYLLQYYKCVSTSAKCPPDKVIVYAEPEKTLALVVFVKTGCVTLAEEISWHDLRQIRLEKKLLVEAANSNPS